MFNSKEKVLLSGALFGNIMEFYNFTIYAFLAVQIGSHFFSFDQTTNILLALSVFATGYIARPLGSLFFGYIGDKYGRKKALLYSISLITFSTFCIGLLPSYATLGILSPILLIILRASQGFSVSGEEGSAAVFLSEILGKSKSGLTGSLVLSSVFIGVLLGSLICLVISLLFTDEFFQDWGWRIPFLISIFLGLTAIYIRKNSIESPKFEILKKNKKILKNPIKNLLKNYKKQIIILTIIPISFSVPTSFYIVFLPNFLIAKSILTQQESMLLISFGMLVIAIITPLFGKLSDKIGYQKMLATGCLLLITLSLPLCIAIFHSYNLIVIAIALTAFVANIAIISAPMFGILVTQFPIEIRCTGVSFCFNTGVAIFSGSTPVILAILTQSLNEVLIIGTYLSFAGFIGLICVNQLQHTRKPSYETIQ